MSSSIVSGPPSYDTPISKRAGFSFGMLMCDTLLVIVKLRLPPPFLVEFRLNDCTYPGVHRPCMGIAVQIKK